MMKDIPYSNLKKDQRAYKMMLLRGQDERTFAWIAKTFGLSVPRVLDIYRGIKFKQMRLYVNHISIVLGYDNCSQVKQIYKQAEMCYQDRTCTCAYLEKKYPDILTEYRNSEPGMPQQFLKKLPPLKSRLNKKTIARIIEMKEVENASFVEIAKRLHITPQKAKHTYDWHYHVKILELRKILYEKAGSEQEKTAIWDDCFRNNHTSKKRYEMLRSQICPDDENR